MNHLQPKDKCSEDDGLTNLVDALTIDLTDLVNALIDK